MKVIGSHAKFELNDEFINPFLDSQQVPQQFNLRNCCMKIITIRICFKTIRISHLTLNAELFLKKYQILNYYLP